MRAKPTRLTDEQRAFRAISEKKLQTKVMALLRREGYIKWHANANPNRFARPGLPDIVAVRDDPPDFLMLELKRELGELREEQVKWISWLKTAGVEVHVIRPSDYEWLKKRLKREG